MTIPQTSAVILESEAKKSRIVDLRREGKTLTEIARLCDCTHPYVHQVLMETYHSWKKSREDLGALMVEEELDRLNSLQEAWWTEALNGNHKAAQLVLKIIESRRRLVGLDPPKKAEIMVTDKWSHEALLAAIDRYGLRVTDEQKKLLGWNPSVQTTSGQNGSSPTN